MADQGQAETAEAKVEKEIRDAFRKGLAVVFEASKASADKTISATFLRELLLSHITDCKVAPVGVVLKGATIRGDLSCVGFGSTAAPLPALDLSRCKVVGRLDLTDSCFSSVTLTGCSLDGLKATYLNVTNGLMADNLTLTSAASVLVDLQGVAVGGDITLKNLGQLAPEGGTCRLQLQHSRIGGSLFCDGAKLVMPAGASSDAAALDLNGVRVSGNVSLTESESHRFESIGETRLLGAAIEGQLLCAGASFQNPAGDALSMDRASVGRSVFLDTSDRYRFESRGVVRLVGSVIGGQLSCEGASFNNLGKNALLMPSASVGGNVLLSAIGNHRFESQGTLDFTATSIGGWLSCLGAHLQGGGARALILTGAEVADRVALVGNEKHGFHADGTIRMQGAKIGSSLHCVGQFLSDREIFDFDNLRVGQSFKVRLDQASHGEVCLRGAHVGELDDNDGQGWGPPPIVPLPGWPSGVSLRLDGFVYDRLCSRPSTNSGSSPDHAADEIWRLRTKWLGRQTFEKAPRPGDYFPQPHEQLTKTLRLMGHDYAARRIACNKSEHEAACGAVGWRLAAVMWVYRRLFGAGYLPMRAVWTVFAFWFLGTGLVCLARSMNDGDSVVLAKSVASVELVRWLGLPDMAPKSPAVEPPRDKQAGKQTVYAPHGKVQTRAVPCDDVKAPLYALDLMVPFVGLRVADKCEMSDNARWWWTYGKAVYAMIGWVIVAVAALTWAGVLRKDMA
jgi:hypothetical protein